IAGTTCDDYVITDKQGKQMLICAAHGMGYLWGANTTAQAMNRMNAMGPTAPPGYAAAMREFKEGFFPLKVSEMVNGKEEVRMLATKLEQGTPPASVFATPPDYTEFEMNMMNMQNMQNMGTPRP